MAHRNRKTNPVLVELLGQLKEAGREGAPIWRDIALRLEKPSRNWAQVNISKLETTVRDGENAVVPGKLLGAGEPTRPMKVVAYTASSAAKEKIAKAGGTVLTLQEGIRHFPKGELCRIVG